MELFVSRSLPPNDSYAVFISGHKSSAFCVSGMIQQFYEHHGIIPLSAYDWRIVGNNGTKEQSRAFLTPCDNGYGIFFARRILSAIS
jgi:hypothetical protein